MEPDPSGFRLFFLSSGAIRGIDVAAQLQFAGDVFGLAAGRDFATLDEFVGVVEVEEADAMQPRRNEGVGRVAGKAGAGDAILDDIEGIDHDGGDARYVLAFAEELACHEPAGADTFLLGCGTCFRRAGAGGDDLVHGGGRGGRAA